MSDFCDNGKIEIIANGFIYRPKSMTEWVKKTYRSVSPVGRISILNFCLIFIIRPVEEFNARATNGEGFAAELDAIQLKLRGQGMGY